jgi:hypothetical protein
MKQDFPAAQALAASFARRAAYFAGWLPRRISTVFPDVNFTHILQGFSTSQ